MPRTQGSTIACSISACIWRESIGGGVGPTPNIPFAIVPAADCFCCHSCIFLIESVFIAPERPCMVTPMALV